MSTDHTPIDRAAEALTALDGRLELLYPEHLDPETVREIATVVVSAALHDPDDPDDWLARLIDAHGETIVYSRLRCRCGWTLPSRGYAAGEARAVFSKHVADAVRAAILGADQ